MNGIILILGTLMAYVLGSIPTAVWVGKAHFGLDIRDYGSGNAGATNTFRVLGKKAGVFVMAIDILKGFAATSLATMLIAEFEIPVSANQLVYLQILFGALSVVGHIFPLFASFKGGKGVATLLGMVLAINTVAATGCIAVFLLVFLTSKYVSLGSMLAALAFPILLLLPLFNKHEPNPVMIGFGFVIFSLVVITHQKNIKRLLKGEENRANIKLRKHRD